ncbi:MAG: hypothetical protein U5L96_00450 [Owenweeksia sp.]|nr:hypothetical protein [Owenweeksia sp.]
MKNQVTNELNAEIELKNGGKWQANPETTEGIDNMIRNIENFKQAETQIS